MNAATKPRAAEPPPSNRRTPEQLVEFVLEAWGESVESIIKVGVRLETAKVEAGHGNWLKVLAGLKMSQSQALKFMRLVGCDNIANTQHTARLPNKIEILDLFRHMTPEIFEAAIADGRINPGMKIKDAKALYLNSENAPRKARKAKPAPAPDRSILPDPIAACVVDVGRIIRETIDGSAWRAALDPALRSQLFAELRTAITNLEAQAEKEKPE